MQQPDATIDLELVRLVDAIDDAYREAKRLPYDDPLRRALADLQIKAHDRRRGRESHSQERQRSTRR
jgi:hypothetical protein